MTIPWTKVAGTIYKMGKVLLTGKELTEQVNALLKERQRSIDDQEHTASRVQQLEQAAAKQLELHRQYQVQMELLRSALEDIQKSMRAAMLMAALSIVVSLAALFLVLYKVAY